MNHIEFWKNFKLGTELAISGSFLYNGLRCLDEIETLYYEEEIFEILYNLSVGLERLIKVAVILIEHNDEVNQEEFEKSLISHNHLDLVKRIENRIPLSLDSPHYEFLALLSTFYKKHRYGRYNINSGFVLNQEKKTFHTYLEKYLKLKIDDSSIIVTSNDKRFKKFIGSIVGKITTQIFDIIRYEAARLNIYTYEIRFGSKAFKIFCDKKFIFEEENIFLKELLVYLINSKKSCGILGFIKEIKPLKFDSGLNQEYLQSFFSSEKRMLHIEEMDELYTDIKNPKERLELLNLIGNNVYYFND